MSVDVEPISLNPLGKADYTRCRWNVALRANPTRASHFLAYQTLRHLRVERRASEALQPTPLS